MAKKTITVSGKRLTSTGIRVDPKDKPNYDAFLRTLPRDAYFKITIEASDPRQDWIDQMYERAMTARDNELIFIKHCQNTTVIANYSLWNPSEIALSAPRHGDKYDRKTGIAVAYAKISGERVPDFI